jgi:hypothetical protein
LLSSYRNCYCLLDEFVESTNIQFYLLIPYYAMSNPEAEP